MKGEGKKRKPTDGRVHAHARAACAPSGSPRAADESGDEIQKTPAVSEEAAGVLPERREAIFWGGSGRATSALDVQAIVGETHALGELAVGLALAAGLVTHVDEIGVLGVHPARHLHRLLDGLVRVVRFVAQGTHHQRAHAAQFRPFAVGERGEIGHVG